MKDKKERRDKQGNLLGPKNAGKWLEWRKARDRSIAKSATPKGKSE